MTANTITKLHLLCKSKVGLTLAKLKMELKDNLCICFFLQMLASRVCLMFRNVLKMYAYDHFAFLIVK